MSDSVATNYQTKPDLNHSEKYSKLIHFWRQRGEDFAIEEEQRKRRVPSPSISPAMSSSPAASFPMQQTPKQDPSSLPISTLKTDTIRDRSGSLSLEEKPIKTKRKSRKDALADGNYLSKSLDVSPGLVPLRSSKEDKDRKSRRSKERNSPKTSPNGTLDQAELLTTPPSSSETPPSTAAAPTPAPAPPVKDKEALKKEKKEKRDSAEKVERQKKYRKSEKGLSKSTSSAVAATYPMTHAMRHQPESGETPAMSLDELKVPVADIELSSMSSEPPSLLTFGKSLSTTVLPQPKSKFDALSPSDVSSRSPSSHMLSNGLPMLSLSSGLLLERSPSGGHVYPSISPSNSGPSPRQAPVPLSGSPRQTREPVSSSPRQSLRSSSPGIESPSPRRAAPIAGNAPPISLPSPRKGTFRSKSPAPLDIDEGATLGRKRSDSNQVFPFTLDMEGTPTASPTEDPDNLEGKSPPLQASYSKEVQFALSTSSPTQKSMNAHNKSLRLFGRPKSRDKEREPRPRSTQIKRVGYLMKKNARHRWKRRWIVVDNENLFVFKSRESEEHKVAISLLTCSVKSLESKEGQEDRYCFHILTKDDNFNFYGETEEEVNGWVATIKSACENVMLGHLGAGRSFSVSAADGDPNNPLYSESSNETYDDVHNNREVLKLLELRANKVCADCGKADPEWASVNHGVFLCIECAGVHRSLGVHISKVRSVYLDHWEREHIERMKAMGNARANEINERNLPSNLRRPLENDSIEAREPWIRAKYVTSRSHLPPSSASSAFGTPQDIRQMLKDAMLSLLREDAQFRQEVREILSRPEPEPELEFAELPRMFQRKVRSSVRSHSVESVPVQIAEAANNTLSGDKEPPVDVDDEEVSNILGSDENESVRQWPKITVSLSGNNTNDNKPVSPTPIRPVTIFEQPPSPTFARPSSRPSTPTSRGLQTSTGTRPTTPPASPRQSSRPSTPTRAFPNVGSFGDGLSDLGTERN
eukprot:TRINITY_DN6106_c0_g1_i1.p1 TRINITY_DN6106_c0_g1~~TRINITY_DN6106_c0_g1_i1.p1  ORF type:complete len:984 (-),score=238.92 TRINITY_DN6106_c0_g1_i1:21-2972(-)